jgi:DNA-dependent RNA polymerase auxiliary subunit epsilon
MTSDDIRLHLEDNHSFNDEQIEMLTDQILDRLDYTLMWQQVEDLTEILRHRL